MDGNFLSKVLVVLCVTCLPLWGTRLDELDSSNLAETADDLEAVIEEVMLITAFVWYGTYPNNIEERIRTRIQEEREALWPDEYKESGWEYLQSTVENTLARFQESVRKTEGLIHLIQVIRNTPRSGGRLEPTDDLFAAIRAQIDS